MCNHYRASGEWRTRVDEFSQTRIQPRFDLSSPRVNVQADDVYPGQVGEILVGHERLEALAATWIFMPAKKGLTWAEWSKTRRGCNNARGEEADGKWPFALSAKTGRCLIPGEAFFEWDDGPKGGKTEYRFAYPDGRALFFAGLCNRVEPDDVGPILTYAMVTKAAGGDTASIGHPRQPVILQADELDAWIDPANRIASFTKRLDAAGTFALAPVKGPKAQLAETA